MSELQQKISKLLQEEQPITESEAQDLAALICEVQAEVKSDGERKLIISIENDTVLFDNLNDFKPLEFMGILHNAVSTADVLYKTKIMQMVEKASKSV
jgi:hypothetical protein